MHPTADTTALMYINRAGRRVMPGVMVPLLVGSLMMAAFAPLSVALLERYLGDVAVEVFCFTSLLFRWRARAAASGRSTITTACTRPANSIALKLNLLGGRVMPGVRPLIT
jgi:hypothetical protein